MLNIYIHQDLVEKDHWNYLVEKFKELLMNVQELILKKLHGGTQMSCMQHKTLMIDIAELINYK